MTKDIVSKLRDHLSRPLDTECAVVYLLAEVRKLLDRDDPNHVNLALWMYCHWALHVDLTNTNTTLHFLELLDDYITAYLSDLTPNKPDTLHDSEKRLKEFAFWESFRSQLRAVLRSYSLPTEFCDDDQSWFAYLSAYAGVIEDGALSSESKRKDTLKAVDRVVFKKGDEPVSPTPHLPFIIQWDIFLKDGRECKVSVEAERDLKTISWNCRLTKASKATGTAH